MDNSDTPTAPSTVIRRRGARSAGRPRATKLRALARIALFEATHLERSELSLWATGARPHYDVVRGPDATDLDGLIERLLATAWSEHTNPHYREGEGR